MLSLRRGGGLAADVAICGDRRDRLSGWWLVVCNQRTGTSVVPVGAAIGEIALVVKADGEIKACYEMVITISNYALKRY